MESITYEQFVTFCEHWGYTVNEGYKAMCFTANIIGQYFGNCVDYANKDHSDAFQRVVEKRKVDAMTLVTFYGSLENYVFDMLEEHENK